MRKGVAVGIVIVLILMIGIASITTNPHKNTQPNVRVGFTFDHYASYSEVKSTLYALQSQYPDIMNVTVIGHTYGWNESSGKYDTPRDIFLVKISDNVSADEDEPEVLIDGLHHAREWLALEVPLYFIQALVTNYSTNDTIKWLVDHREIYVVPMVNPDGYVYDGNGDLNAIQDWRKNCRDNDGDGVFENDGWFTIEGVDLNRNYDIDWINGSSDPNSITYRGPAPFSEPETRALRDFALNHTINLYLTYHSYSSEILVPPGYSYDAPRPYDYVEFAIGTNMSKLMPTTQYSVVKSTDLYPASGAAEDWFQSVEHAISFTIELEGNDFHPPTSSILPACENNYPSMVYALMTGDMSIHNGTFPAKPYIIYGYAAYPNLPVKATDLATGDNITVMPESNGFYMLNLGTLAHNWSFTDRIEISNGAASTTILPTSNWGVRVDLQPVPEFNPMFVTLLIIIILALGRFSSK